MSEELYEAIARLQAWIRDYGHEKEPVFIRDLKTVIEAVNPEFELSVMPFINSRTDDIVYPWCTKTGQNACSCHERDGSFVCEFCLSQGMKGNMQ